MSLRPDPSPQAGALPEVSRFLRGRGFRNLWASGAVESAGDEASRTLVPIIAVSMLGASAFDVGVINALGLSAFLVLGVPIGVWVDRMRKRRIMIAADLCRAAVIASLPAVYLFGALTIWHLFLAVAVISVADVFFTTAHSTFLPLIVRRNDLSEANARLQSAQTAVTVATPALSGALLRIAAAPLALFTASVSYTLSAVLIGRIKHVEFVPPTEGRPAPIIAAKEGISFTVRHPILRPLFLSGMIINTAAMFGNAASAVYALTVLGISPGVYAAVGAVSALGGLSGSVVAVPILRRFGIGRTKIVTSLAALPVISLLPLAGVLPYPPVIWVGVSGFGWASLIVMTSIAGSGITPRVTPARMLGSVTASSRLFVLGIMPVASLIGGAIAAWAGVVPVLWAWAAIAAVSALPIIFSPIRRWKNFPEELDVNMPD
ncbi:MFS transporter [Arthrobacter sp. H14]|uniref:MFS transporter n=1 Tax=Arthrobacter sp. H14 TaxID=1312959 RepID=UPI0009DDF5AD|nr:MFS transporter [Arthrobacter sp. H14]